MRVYRLWVPGLLAVALVSLSILWIVGTPIWANGDPVVRSAIISASLPVSDTLPGAALSRTVYFDPDHSGLITVTLEISGTPTLTLTAAAAFAQPQRVYTSTISPWTATITYSVAAGASGQAVGYTLVNTHAHTTTLTLSFVADAALPQVTMSAPVSGTVFNAVSPTLVSVSGAASDLGAGLQGVSLTADGGLTWAQAVGLKDWSWDWAVPAGQDYKAFTLTARGADWLGHEGRDWARVWVDNVLPSNPALVTTTNGIRAGAWISASTIPVGWSAVSDGSGVRYEYIWSQNSTWNGSGGQSTTGTSAVGASLPQGDNWFHLRTRDGAGNPAAAIVHLGLFKVDTVAPTAMITAPAVVQPGQGIPVAWSAQDERSGLAVRRIEYKKGDGAWQTWLSNVPAVGQGTFVTVTANSTYTFRLVVQDNAGNPAQDQAVTRVTWFDVYLPITLRNYAPFCNGNFDQGWTCWQHDGLFKQAITSAQAWSGGDSQMVLLGDSSYNNTGGVPVGHGRVWQTFNVPDMDDAHLTLRYRIYTHDLVWSDKYQRFYDSFEIHINTMGSDAQRNTLCRAGLGNPSVTAAGGLVFCNGNPANPSQTGPAKDLGWRQVTLDLSAFKGQTITLYVAVFNRVDGWYNTWAYVDDVVLYK